MTRPTIQLQRRSLVFDSTTIGLLVVDPKTLRIVDANKQAQSMFENFFPVLVGELLERLWHPEDFEHCLSMWAEIVEGRRRVCYRRMRYARPHGDLTSADIEVTGISDRNESPMLISIQLLHSSYRSTSDAMLSLLAQRPNGDTVARGIRFGLLQEYQPYAVLIQSVDFASHSLTNRGSSGFSNYELNYLDGVTLDTQLPATQAARNHTDVVVTYRQFVDDYPLARPLFPNDLAEHMFDRLAASYCIESQGVIIGILSCALPADSANSFRLQRRMHLATTTAGAWLVSHVHPPDHDRSSSSRGLSTRISDRQRTILRLICEGKTNRDIADQLSYSAATIKADIRQIMSNLGVNNRSELIEMATSTRLFIAESENSPA